MSIYNLRYEEGLINAVEDEVICNDKYCPFFIEHMSSPNNPNCEGRYCEEAYENYLEDIS